jgi:DMSO/TMAO reductase YedYZ molybdopterin-dependent catalytic subunit
MVVDNREVVMVGGKSPLKLTWLVIIMVMVVLLVSCSWVAPSQNVSLSPVPETSPEFKLAPRSADVIPGLTTGPGETVLTYQDLGRFVSSDPARIDNSEFPITPVEEIHLTGTPRDVDIASYRLSVVGLVDSPLALSYQELLQFASITRVVLLICPGFFVDNAEWTGVPVKSVLARAGLRPEAREVTVHSVDGYSQTFSLQDSQKDGFFLSYQVNGQILPREHGYPLRLVVEGAYGGRWAKWVDQLEIQ